MSQRSTPIYASQQFNSNDLMSPLSDEDTTGTTGVGQAKHPRKLQHSKKTDDAEKDCHGYDSWMSADSDQIFARQFTSDSFEFEAMLRHLVTTQDLEEQRPTYKRRSEYASSDSMSSQDPYFRDSGKQDKAGKEGTVTKFSPPARRELGEQDSGKKATRVLADRPVRGAAQSSMSTHVVAPKPDGDAQGSTTKLRPCQPADLTEDQVGAVPLLLENLQISRDDVLMTEIVGRGASSEVWRGEWRGEIVAVKRLNNKRGTPKQDAAFLREAAIVGQLSHKHLVKMHGLCFNMHPYLLISELCVGGSLFELLYEDPDVNLALSQKMKMCCDVACVMDYLHTSKPKIIHRDLKSLNLLLDQRITTASDVPHVKVSDFGLSRMQDQLEIESVKMTAGIGTVNWMAPEAMSKKYTEKVDVYSFAMVVYEIFCEEVPFEEFPVGAILQSVREGERPDLDKCPADTPEDMKKVIARCWATYPSRRPSFEVISRIVEATAAALS